MEFLVYVLYLSDYYGINRALTGRGNQYKRERLFLILYFRLGEVVVIVDLSILRAWKDVLLPLNKVKSLDPKKT